MQLLKSRMVVVLLLVAAVLGAPAPSARADVFTQQFAQRVKQVQATPGSEDDRALAGEMMQEARMLIEPAEVVPLAKAAAELARTDESGAELAAEALKLWAEHSPDDRTAALEHLVDMRQQQFAMARTQEERPIAGEALIEALMLAGEAAMKAGDHAQAVPLSRRAVMVAASIKSARADKAREQLDRATAAAARAQRVDTLQQRVKANAADVDAARQLMRIYVLEMDDPAAAAPLLHAAEDAAWKTNVPLAAKSVTELTGEQMRQLGDWYRTLLTTAPPGSRIVPLGRAFTYYGYYLRDHAQDAAQRQAIEQAQKLVESQIYAIDQVPPVIEARVVDTGNPRNRRNPRRMPVRAPAADDPDNALFQALRAPQEARKKDTGWIDLLEAIAPQRDAVAGQWGSEGGAVQGTSAGELAYMKLPVRIQGSYRMFLALTPREGSGAIALVLPVGGKAVELRLPMDNPRRGGFQAGQGQAPGLTLQGAEILPGDSCTLQVDVKIEGDQAELTAFLDDAPWSRWKGTIAELALPADRYQLDPGAPAFAVDAAEGQPKLLVDLVECKLKPTQGRVQVFGL